MSLAFLTAFTFTLAGEGQSARVPDAQHAPRSEWILRDDGKPPTVRAAEGQLRVRLQAREAVRRHAARRKGDPSWRVWLDALLVAAIVWALLYGWPSHGRRVT